MSFAARKTVPYVQMKTSHPPKSDVFPFFCRGDIRQWSWVWEKEIEKVFIVFHFVIKYILNLTIKGSH